MSTTYHTAFPNGFALNASEFNSRTSSLDAAIASLAATTGLNSICNGRLTLTTNTPVTTSDVTAATTLRFSAYQGNRVAVYNGAAWDMLTFSSDRTISVPATTDTNYDVYIYSSSGTLTLELTAWSDSTAGAGSRATALTTQDGVLVKSGTPTRRFLGMMRTTGVSGQTEDSMAGSNGGKRFVVNYYNRVPRPIQVIDTTNTWTYGTAAWRSLNNSTSNRAQFLVPVAESPVYFVHNMSSTTITTYSGIALNATNTSDAQLKALVLAGNATSTSVYEATPSANFHFLQATEYAAAATATIYGDNNTPTIVQMGMIGWIWG